MTPQITEQIEGRDGFELVRDQIAAILVLESEHQVSMAAAAVPPKEPEDWRLRVFTERSNPIEEFRSEQSEDAAAKSPPIVNVWFDSSEFDASSSNVVERQKCTGSFNVDVYAEGVAEDDGVDGHVPSDELAARNLHAAVRLVRRILMGGSYTYLGLRGLVWKRWLASVTSFQPQSDVVRVEKIIAARMVFQVDFNELSPQYVGQPFSELSISVKRKATGELYVDATYAADS